MGMIRRIGAALAVGGMLALAGCTAGEAPVVTATATASPTATPSATPTPSRTSAAPPREADVPAPETHDVTCDTMLTPDVDAALRARGLTPAPKPWTAVGYNPLGAAIECPWAWEAGSHGEVYYAWAEFPTPDERERFVQNAIELGYPAEDTADGTWLGGHPIDPAPSAILVTDGWVAIADSREGIRDIVWAR